MKLYSSFSTTIVSSFCFVILAATATVVVVDAETAFSYSSLETPERVEGYQQRGYEWPVPKFVPDTPGWNQLMTDRLEQVSQIEDPEERFKGYTATMYSGLVIANYTEYGFARTRISDSLLGELQQGIVDGYDNRRNEGYAASITGNQPWHIQNDDLTAKVEEELHEKLEEWGGIELDLTYVYGLRLFRNTSTIKMHMDRKGSHAMGYVLHVASSEDADETDPWPFILEDLHGRTHEIIMAPGDLIFFESAKLVHGRPHKLNASWYCNVVGHYSPRDEVWASMNHLEEAKYAVPPKWVHDGTRDDTTHNDGDGNTNEEYDDHDDAALIENIDFCDGTVSPVSSVLPTINTKKNKNMNKNRVHVEAIEFRGGLREPDCVDGWCRATSPERVKWQGPAGSNTHWIDATGQTHEFIGRSKKVEEL